MTVFFNNGKMTEEAIKLRLKKLKNTLRTYKARNKPELVAKYCKEIEYLENLLKEK